MIADTFLSLLRHQPYRDIQITSLCQAADIPRRAFYRYFDSKEDIITFLVEDMFHNIFQDYEVAVTTEAEGIKRSTRFFQRWLDRPQLLEVMARQDTFGLFYGAFMRFTSAQNLVTSYMLPTSSPTDAKLSGILATSSLFHLLVHWQFTHTPETAEELAAFYIHYLTTPLLPSP